MTEDRWHQPLGHVRGRELRGDTGQTPGMTRREAISGQNAGSEKVWLGQTHVAPGTTGPAGRTSPGDAARGRSAR